MIKQVSLGFPEVPTPIETSDCQKSRLGLELPTIEHLSRGMTPSFGCQQIYILLDSFVDGEK
jgi:hypothetical protein